MELKSKEDLAKLLTEMEERLNILTETVDKLSPVEDEEETQKDETPTDEKEADEIEAMLNDI